MKTTYAAIAILFLTQCISVGEPDREKSAFPLGESKILNWEQVFRTPSAISEFEILHTGQVEVPVEGMLNPDRAREHFDTETTFVDVYAFWFCHRQHGCYLIDSGLDDSYGEGKEGNVHGLLAKSYIVSSRQKPGTNILSQLARENRKQRLKGVFFTHLHGDHTSGVPALTSDPAIGPLEFYVAAGEPYINYWMLYQGDHLDNVGTLKELPDSGQEMPILGQALDLFGDGSLWAIPTPGHSGAHLSYLIVTENGPVLLTGDASHTKVGFEHGIEPGWADDRREARNSLSRLIEFSQSYPEVRIIYGHER